MKHWPGSSPPTDSVLHIDWQQPWFKPWAQCGEKVQLHWQAQPEQLHLALNLSLPHGLEALISSKPIDFENEAVEAKVQKTVSFVSQQDLHSDIAYESFVFQHRKIPTRNNAHDFFNGLCWLRFPQTKAQLNRLQAQAIARDGVGAHRGTLRDALTLFDENTALLYAPASLWEALKNKQWLELFVTNRDAWQQVKLVVFGHALLEKLLQPYKGITAHVLCLPMPLLISDEEVDAWLCQQLTPTFLQTKPFLPMPLAGVPGWWPGNEVPAFFEDKKVFRD